MLIHLKKKILDPLPLNKDEKALQGINQTNLNKERRDTNDREHIR